MRLRELSLRTILVLAMAALVLLPFAGVYALWHVRTTAVTSTTVGAYGMEVLRQLQTTLDDYFGSLKRRVYSSASTSAFTDFLEMRSKDPYEDYRMERRFTTEVFHSLTFEHQEVANIGIMNHYGNVMAEQGRLDFLATYEAVRAVLPQESLENPAILGPWRTGSPSLGEVVSAVYAVSALNRPGAPGMLIVDLRWSALRYLFEQVRAGPEGSILVFDRDGRLIYPERRADAAGRSAPRRETLTDYPVRRRSESTGWTLAIRTQLSGLSSDLTGLQRLSGLVMAALLALLLLITVGIGLAVTRALGVVERGMADVARGVLKPIPPAQGGKELIRIHDGYNQMVQRLRDLIEVVHESELREREMVIHGLESEILHIQSRIHPHFLYNTLEVINSYAIDAGNPKISAMIASLADVFRWSTSAPQGLVSLEEEIGHLQSYLSIQREIYPDLLISLRIRREIRRTVRLPRLTLQPLVENALVHGYEGHRRRVGYVGLAAVRTDGAVEIAVRDRGLGMPKAAREELDRLLAVAGTGHLADTEPRIAGRRPLGLWNVHCRLRLAFGDPYGMRITRSDARGTTVAVCVPASGGQEAP